ncbi:unnamed protein product [Ectocarpus sp. 12 AP-2014]
MYSMQSILSPLDRVQTDSLADSCRGEAFLRYGCVRTSPPKTTTRNNKELGEKKLLPEGRIVVVVCIHRSPRPPPTPSDMSPLLVSFVCISVGLCYTKRYPNAMWSIDKIFGGLQQHFTISNPRSAPEACGTSCSHTRSYANDSNSLWVQEWNVALPDFPPFHNAGLLSGSKPPF